MDRPRIREASPQSALYPSGLQAQPFGETSYLELIEHYAGEARKQQRAGAARLALRDMPGLHEARAALLGARTAGLPVSVSLAAARDGGLLPQEEALAALLCLQALGAAAFGFEFDRVTADLIGLYAYLAPYAQLPLLARPAAADRRAASSLLCAGVEILVCTAGDAATRAAMESAVDAHPPVSRPPRPEDAPLLLCGVDRVYYLEEDFTLSEELRCSLDMLEDILALEEAGCDALCFHVETVDDAHFLGLNAHMARCAVCIRAGSAAALEMALMLYSGRALVDARSDLEQGELAALASLYGAVVR